MTQENFAFLRRQVASDLQRQVTNRQIDSRVTPTASRPTNQTWNNSWMMLTPAGGIPAASGSLPGQAGCRPHLIDNGGTITEQLNDAGQSVQIVTYNISTKAVPGNTYVPAIMVGGKAVAINEGDGGGGESFFLHFTCSERFGESDPAYVNATANAVWGTQPPQYDPQAIKCHDALGIFADLQTGFEGIAVWRAGEDYFEILTAQRLPLILRARVDSRLIPAMSHAIISNVSVYPNNPFAEFGGLSMTEVSNPLSLDAPEAADVLLRRDENYTFADGGELKDAYYVEHVIIPNARFVVGKAVTDLGNDEFEIETLWHADGKPPAPIGQTWTADFSAVDDWMKPFVNAISTPVRDEVIFRYDNDQDWWRPIGYENWIARWIKVSFQWPDDAGPTTVSGLDGYFDGYAPPQNPLEVKLDHVPECPTETIAKGYAFWDPNDKEYILVSTYSALMGKPSKYKVRSEKPATGSGSGDISCDGGQTCIDVPVEYEVKEVEGFPCGPSGGSGSGDTNIDRISICVNAPALVDCLDICTYICDNCPQFASPDVCPAPCGNCTYTWNGTSWDLTSTDCGGDCQCQPPTNPGSQIGETIITDCSHDDPGCNDCLWYWNPTTQSWSVYDGTGCGAGCSCTNEPNGGAAPDPPDQAHVVSVPCTKDDPDPPDPPECGSCRYVWSEGTQQWVFATDGCEGDCECVDPAGIPAPTDPVDPLDPPEITVDCEKPPAICACPECTAGHTFSVIELNGTLSGVAGYTLIGGPYTAEGCTARVPVRWGDVLGSTKDTWATVTYGGGIWTIALDDKSPDSDTAGRWSSGPNYSGCTHLQINCNPDGDCGELEQSALRVGETACPVTSRSQAKLTAEDRRHLNDNLGERVKYLFPWVFQSCKTCGGTDAYNLLNRWGDEITPKRLEMIVGRLLKAHKGRQSEHSIRAAIVYAMSVTV